MIKERAMAARIITIYDNLQNKVNAEALLPSHDLLH